MIADAIETLVNKPDFKIHVFAGKNEYFEVGASDESALTAFLLRRERIKSGLSLAEVARRDGLFALESRLDDVPNKFLKLGVQSGTQAALFAAQNGLAELGTR